MTDVEKGGATVFPYIKVKVPPVKGSAAFWYNLHPSGEPGKVSERFNMSHVN
jgi:prolyl 4-hydroxylase